MKQRACTQTHTDKPTYQSGAQAEDSGLSRLAVDVSAEEAVAHVVRFARLAVILTCAQVHHGVRGRDEIDVRAQVELETLAESVDLVMDPPRHVQQVLLAEAPPPAPVVRLAGERLAEVIEPQRRDDLVR